jgi:hypothetical protein
LSASSFAVARAVYRSANCPSTTARICAPTRD